MFPAVGYDGSMTTETTERCYICAGETTVADSRVMRWADLRRYIRVCGDCERNYR